MVALPRTIELIKRGGNEEVFVLRYIDQRLLPLHLKMEETSDSDQVVDAIKMLAIRGAPALGVAGAAAFTLWFNQYRRSVQNEKIDPQKLADLINSESFRIANARPTAVNLSWGVEQIKQFTLRQLEGGLPLFSIAESLYGFVKDMEAEDERTNRLIGRYGAELLPQHASVLTHCNAGSLATVYYGTALGVIYSAFEQGKLDHVYIDETRPVGQGSRLTAWELSQSGIPSTLECDNMAAFRMANGSVDAVIVGADRIAANGDTANKIGTYMLAIAANYHNVPFYVAAPTSTIDSSLPDGSSIPIEQRSASEIIDYSLSGIDVWNPAFDVTPSSLITAIITEEGVKHFG